MSTAKPKRRFSEEKLLILEEFSLCKDILIPKSGRYENMLASHTGVIAHAQTLGVHI